MLCSLANKDIEVKNLIVVCKDNMAEFYFKDQQGNVYTENDFIKINYTLFMASIVNGIKTSSMKKDGEYSFDV